MSNLYISLPLLLVLKLSSALKNCQNGGTSKDGICHCPAQFEGNECQHRNCGSHGYRQKEGTCICLALHYLMPVSLRGGFEGEFCELPKCVTGERINGSCVCDPDFDGVFCEGVSKCVKGYRVTQTAVDDQANRYESGRCVCDIAWSGAFCDRYVRILGSKNESDVDRGSSTPLILLFLVIGFGVSFFLVWCFYTKSKRLYWEKDEAPKPKLKPSCCYKPVAYTERSMPVGPQYCDPRIRSLWANDTCNVTSTTYFLK